MEKEDTLQYFKNISSYFNSSIIIKFDSNIQNLNCNDLISTIRAEYSYFYYFKNNSEISKKIINIYLNLFLKFNLKIKSEIEIILKKKLDENIKNLKNFQKYNYPSSKKIQNTTFFDYYIYQKKNFLTVCCFKKKISNNIKNDEEKEIVFDSINNKINILKNLQKKINYNFTTKFNGNEFICRIENKFNYGDPKIFVLSNDTQNQFFFLSIENLKYLNIINLIQNLEKILIFLKNNENLNNENITLPTNEKKNDLNEMLNLNEKKIEKNEMIKKNILPNNNKNVTSNKEKIKQQNSNQQPPQQQQNSNQQPPQQQQNSNQPQQQQQNSNQPPQQQQNSSNKQPPQQRKNNSNENLQPQIKKVSNPDEILETNENKKKLQTENNENKKKKKLFCEDEERKKKKKIESPKKQSDNPISKNLIPIEFCSILNKIKDLKNNSADKLTQNSQNENPKINTVKILLEEEYYKTNQNKSLGGQQQNSNQPPQQQQNSSNKQPPQQRKNNSNENLQPQIKKVSNPDEILETNENKKKLQTENNENKKKKKLFCEDEERKKKKKIESPKKQSDNPISKNLIPIEFCSILNKIKDLKNNSADKLTQNSQNENPKINTVKILEEEYYQNKSLGGEKKRKRKRISLVKKSPIKKDSPKKSPKKSPPKVIISKKK
jgi:hypothetical protein